MAGGVRGTEGPSPVTPIAVYWVTGSITSSMRLYKEFAPQLLDSVGLSLDVTVPVGLSLFPHEMLPPPDYLVKKRFRNILQFKHHDTGGHFAAMEKPQLLANDLADFVRLLGLPG